MHVDPLGRAYSAPNNSIRPPCNLGKDSLFIWTQRKRYTFIIGNHRKTLWFYTNIREENSSFSLWTLPRHCNSLPRSGVTNDVGLNISIMTSKTVIKRIIILFTVSIKIFKRRFVCQLLSTTYDIQNLGS